MITTDSWDLTFMKICSLVSSVPVFACCNRAHGIGSAGAQLHFNVVIANNIMPCIGTHLLQWLYPCLHSVRSWTTVLCTCADLPEISEARPSLQLWWLQLCDNSLCNRLLACPVVMITCIISSTKPFLQPELLQNLYTKGWQILYILMAFSSLILPGFL